MFIYLCVCLIVCVFVLLLLYFVCFMMFLLNIDKEKNKLFPTAKPTVNTQAVLN